MSMSWLRSRLLNYDFLFWKCNRQKKYTLVLTVPQVRRDDAVLIIINDITY